MHTSLLFVIQIISASGSLSSGSSCGRFVPCLILPISIRNLTPGPWFCLCPLALSAKWTHLGPSCKNIADFATGSCPSRQEVRVSCLTAIRMAHLFRDRNISYQRDLQGLHASRNLPPQPYISHTSKSLPHFASRLNPLSSFFKTFPNPVW